MSRYGPQKAQIGIPHCHANLEADEWSTRAICDHHPDPNLPTYPLGYFRSSFVILTLDRTGQLLTGVECLLFQIRSYIQPPDKEVYKYMHIHKHVITY